MQTDSLSCLLRSGAVPSVVVAVVVVVVVVVVVLAVVVVVGVVVVVVVVVGVQGVVMVKRLAAKAPLAFLSLDANRLTQLPTTFGCDPLYASDKILCFGVWLPSHPLSSELASNKAVNARLWPF